ncbi:MAG: GNAT family N-acetyltransferase, partial [Atribacterota bacterium]
TVLSPIVIKNRILNKKYEIFVALINRQIVGTVSLSMKDQDQIYIRSMAVHPDYQKRGVGLFILKKINELAKRKNIKTISLDTTKQLKRAIKFLWY